MLLLLRKIENSLYYENYIYKPTLKYGWPNLIT